MFKIPGGMHDGGDHSWNGGIAHSPRFWTLIGVLMLAGILGADLIWAVLEEGTTLMLEFLAERLERFYQARFGLDIYHAQMATAYTGAAALVLAGLLGLRKLSKLIRYVREDGSVWWHEHYASVRDGTRRKMEQALRWWLGLDLLNKSAVVIGLVVMGVPFAALLSYGLGKVVTEIL